MTTHNPEELTVKQAIDIVRTFVPPNADGFRCIWLLENGVKIEAMRGKFGNDNYECTPEENKTMRDACNALCIAVLSMMAKETDSNLTCKMEYVPGVITIYIETYYGKSPLLSFHIGYRGLFPNMLASFRFLNPERDYS